MSWRIALSTSQRAEAPPLPATPLHTAAQPGLTVAVGGNQDTCAFHSDADSSSGWAVVGTGILLSGLRATMMTHADWANALDLIHSAAVSGNGIYDNRKVVAAVDRYYRGDGRGRSAVDWWLTFELWKQALSGSPGRGSNPGGARRYR